MRITIHAFIQALLLLLPLTLSSCITILKGTKADVTLTGSVPEPVDIRTTTDTFSLQQLPTTIQVKKSDLDKPISVESEHYLAEEVIPGQRSNIWSIAQLIGPLSVPGFIVDLATGGLYKPKQDTLMLSFIDKSDSTIPLSDIISKQKFAPRNVQPDYFYRNEISFNAGFGLLLSKPYEKLSDDLCHHYNLESGLCGLNLSGVLNANYYYHLNNRLALGGTFGFNVDGKYLEEERPNYELTYHNEGNIHYRLLYLLPSVKYTWAHLTHISFYSRVAIGPAYRWFSFDGEYEQQKLHIDRSGWQVSGYCAPIGIDAGRKHVHGFLECNVGSVLQLVTAGISFRF